MTISFIREFHASSASSGTAASCAIGTSPAAGNHLVVTFSSSTNDTIPTPAGWTAIGSQTVDTTNIATFWKKAAGTETTVAVTLAASGNWNIHYAEFNSTVAGNWTAGVVANNVPQAAGTALATGTTAATTKANALAWGTVTYAGARQTPSWSNTFTSNTGTASSTVVFALESAYKILSATGTQTSTDTVGVSVAAGWTGQIVTFYEPILSSFVKIIRAGRRPNFARRGTGRTISLALTQQPTPPPPYLAPTNRQQRRTLGSRRRPQPQVPLTSTTVVVTYTPAIASPRRRGGWVRRRQQPVAPIVAVTYVLPPESARRRIVAQRRRQQPAVPTVSVAYTPPIGRSVRRQLWARDRIQPVTPPAPIVASTVSYVPSPSRIARRGLWVGRRQQPVFPNQSVAVVQAVLLPDVASARRRHGFTRRGRLVAVTIAQTAALAPQYVPPTARQPRRIAWTGRRQQPVAPTIVVSVVPTIGSFRRRVATSRRRQQPAITTSVTQAVAASTPPVPTVRRRLAWLRRGRLQPTTPQAQIVTIVIGSGTGSTFLAGPGVATGIVHTTSATTIAGPTVTTGTAGPSTSSELLTHIETGSG